jgi:hypothetical protein
MRALKCGARSAIHCPWSHLSFQNRVHALSPTSEMTTIEKKALTQWCTWIGNSSIPPMDYLACFFFSARDTSFGGPNWGSEELRCQLAKTAKFAGVGWGRAQHVLCNARQTLLLFQRKLRAFAWSYLFLWLPKVGGLPPYQDKSVLRWEQLALKSVCGHLC